MQIEFTTFFKCSTQFFFCLDTSQKNAFCQLHHLQEIRINREDFQTNGIWYPQFVLDQHKSSNTPSVLSGITLIEEKTTFLPESTQVSRGNSALKRVLTSALKTGKSLPSNGVLYGLCCPSSEYTVEHRRVR